MVTKKRHAGEKAAPAGKGISEDELDDSLDVLERGVGDLSGASEGVQAQASKPISKLQKGDTITIDGKSYTVDAHEVLIDHGSTKEMAIELYDDKDTDYQLRYFDDQSEKTLGLYELQEIIYIKKSMKSISW